MTLIYLDQLDDIQQYKMSKSLETIIKSVIVIPIVGLLLCGGTYCTLKNDKPHYQKEPEVRRYYQPLEFEYGKKTFK